MSLQFDLLFELLNHLTGGCQALLLSPGVTITSPTTTFINLLYEYPLFFFPFISPSFYFSLLFFLPFLFAFSPVNSLFFVLHLPHPPHLLLFIPYLYFLNSFYLFSFLSFHYYSLYIFIYYLTT